MPVDSAARDPVVSERLVERAFQGDRASLARAISLVENETAAGLAILKAAFPRTGPGIRLGITGPPGAGKSTLSARLAGLYRTSGEPVAIVAVDPTSPFSGGALLGDRVRMVDLQGDSGVFIRSMASRGSLGGLAATTSDVCDVLEAAGFRRVLIETVGVGQSELEVAETADTILVVLVPESGDAVQALKAGLMEIGDVFVINKADREGAERAAHQMRLMLRLAQPRDGWQPPVLLTEARSGQGVPELAGALQKHYEYLSERGLLARRRRRRLEERVDELVRGRAHAGYRSRVPESRRDAILDQVEQRALTPHEAAETLHAEAWPELSGSRTSNPRS